MIQVYNYVYEPPVSIAKQQQTFQDSLIGKESPFARMSQRRTIGEASKYNTYTSKVSTFNLHPNRDYPMSQATQATHMSKLEEKQKMAESVINQDYEKGPSNVQQQLNSMVLKYEEPNIFVDSKRQKYLPTHYRQGYLDNKNKILNNNTSLRVFGRNNPTIPEVKPHLDQNIAGIRPKQTFITYEADNPGILKRTKSMHYRKLQQSQIQANENFQEQKPLTQSQSVVSFSGQSGPITRQQVGQSLVLPSYVETQHYLQKFDPIYNSTSNLHSLREQNNPLKQSGQNMLTLKDEKQPDNYYRSGKIGNSFNEIDSRTKALQRMVQNETRSRMLANDYLSNYQPMVAVDMPKKETSHQQIWKQPQSVIVNTIPEPIIQQNQFYQIDQVYQSSKANNNGDKIQEPRNPQHTQASGLNDNDYGMNNIIHQKNNSMIEVPKWNDQKFSSYKGLGSYGSMEQFHPAIPQKSQFKDMLALSQTLDRNITQTMRHSGSSGKILFF